MNWDSPLPPFYSFPSSFHLVSFPCPPETKQVSAFFSKEIYVVLYKTAIDVGNLGENKCRF